MMRLSRFAAVAFAALVLCPLAFTQTPAPTPIATPIASVEHNILHRPIAQEDGLRHWADRSYPYGGTQGGTRAAHLGVEFVNPRGTPVHASLAGTVFFAGADTHKLLGPALDYYGNAVILAHEVETLAGERIFTLYAHLDSIAVESGQRVDNLDLIGTVGSTGIAIGAHLHFEVRADKPFDYLATRNPELWLRNYPGRGMVIGAARDADGESVHEWRLTLRKSGFKREVHTYASERVNPDAVRGENFTISDLKAGEYELVALSETGGIAFREQVTVDSGQATFVDIVLD